MAKKSLEERIEGAKSFLKENLNTVRAGRANPALLDKVQVEYYGTPTPLKALANISVPDPRTPLISVVCMGLLSFPIPWTISLT